VSELRVASYELVGLGRYDWDWECLWRRALRGRISVTEQILSVSSELPFNMNWKQPRQKLDACSKNRNGVRVGVIARGVPESPLEKHASALADLHHRTTQALFSTGKVRGRIELH
jgi:hypothetical protein